MSETLHIAIVGTPRSGNTWLHRMLGRAYGLEIRTIHRPADLDWDSLPARCLVQLHWHPTREFTGLLARNEFKPIVLCRHPLDVLISILHFARYDDTRFWLDGEKGGESGITRSSPTDAAFLEYAKSPRAAALLGLSREWQSQPDVFVVRYEALVQDPVAELQRVGGWLGRADSVQSLTDAVAANTLENNRGTVANCHFWQGQPGLWRKFIHAADARSIASSHLQLFEPMDYMCNPDEAVTRESGNHAWNTLLKSDLDQLLVDYKEQARLVVEQQKLIDQLNKVLESAEQWQRSLFKRTFHRWHRGRL